MYTIIGGDGREYGPVTAEQVQAWIAAGRANLNSKCKLADSFDWKTVADFPELSGPPPLGAPALPPLAGPMAVTVAAPLDIMSCYERSWKLLKAHFWSCVGVTLIMWLFTGTLIGLQFGLHNRGIGLLSVFLNPLLWGGLNTFYLAKVRGTGAPGLGDFIGGLGKHYLPLLGIYILTYIFTAVGIVCLLIPGIFVAVIFQFSSFFEVDLGPGTWESMMASHKAVKGNWWRVFALDLLAIPFSLIGLACLGLGLFVTTPLIMGAIYYAYEDLRGRPRA